jgi:hypothetical protein
MSFPEDENSGPFRNDTGLLISFHSIFTETSI